MRCLILLATLLTGCSGGEPSEEAAGVSGNPFATVKLTQANVRQYYEAQLQSDRVAVYSCYPIVGDWIPYFMGFSRRYPRAGYADTHPAKWRYFGGTQIAWDRDPPEGQAAAGRVQTSFFEIEGTNLTTSNARGSRICKYNIELSSDAAL